MSLITKENRISVKPFAPVPPLLSLPSIKHPPASVSGVSSRQGTARSYPDIREGCLVTKSVKHTHEIVHWINSVQDEYSSLVEELVDDLNIMTFSDFDVEMPYNLAYLEPSIHAALDQYGFIAITASSSTLDGLIEMMRSDIEKRQNQIDKTGKACHRYRSIDFSNPSFVNPEYELVALRPEHFLPNGTILTIYDPPTREYTNYVAAQDQRLRQGFTPDSPRMPAFRHQRESSPCHRMNVFLVVMNAEIKFRRYFEEVRMDPPATPLPDDVLALMRRTMELVELIYWQPLPQEGTEGERVLRARVMRDVRQSRAQDDSGTVEDSWEECSEEMETGMDWRKLYVASRAERRKRFHDHNRLMASMDSEARMAYLRSIICDHDRDYAVPLNDTPGMYSETSAVDAWAQGVCPEPSGERVCGKAP